MTRRYAFYSVLTLAASLVFALSAFSQTAQILPTSPSKDFPNVKISNFGKMDDRFYRGAQPKKGQYQALKDLGIKTIIDLQNEPTDYEKPEAEALGLRYVNIPIVDKGYPTDANIAAFLKTIDDPETGVFYLHCAGGRHRTGDMGALYRFTKNGWNFDQAFQEMENYDFYTSHGHGKQKDFVSDYAAKMIAQKGSLAAAPVSASVAK
jgi:tyrosine-protein phosphatase SIW14